MKERKGKIETQKSMCRQTGDQVPQLRKARSWKRQGKVLPRTVRGAPKLLDFGLLAFKTVREYICIV